MLKKQWVAVASLCVILLAFWPVDSQAKKGGRYFRTYRIVLMGDSFTAGYGLDEEQAYGIALRNLLNLRFPHDRIEVINAGVVGDVATSAVYRVQSVLALKPDIVVLALGGSDALRKTDPDIVYKALDQILATLTHNNIYVMLTGFKAPPDASIEYVARFNRIYPQLVDRYRVAFFSNLLDGVEDTWYRLQHDGIYPNEEGMEHIADNLYNPLSSMLRRIRSMPGYRHSTRRLGQM